MKFTKFMTAILMMAAITLISCKGKSSKDLIVNKWQMSGMSGKGSADITDSAKTKMYSDFRIEFKKDGKFDFTDMETMNLKHGVYSLSDDGKTLISKDDGSENSDTISILEIKVDKLVLEDKKSEIKVTFKSN